MPNITRREFASQMGSSLVTFLLVRTLCRDDVIAGPASGAANRSLIEMERLSNALASGKLEPLEWQRGIESSLAHIELRDLLASIDYDRLARNVVLSGDYEWVEQIALSRKQGLPGSLSFSPHFYALQKGQAIVPHGHHNMATMHMVLRGQARVRQFERVADDPQYMTIRPTKDKVSRPGELSTISDQSENIHWFVALTEPVYLFNIGVYDIQPGIGYSGRDYVDATGGERLTGGAIRAKKLNQHDAYRLYGKSGA
ncbi:MAG: hypothetical protein AABO41_18715 [Acidobacteriota bacterium]